MNNFVKGLVRMNKKKIIILGILFVAVAGLALGSASAATKTHKTDKLYFKSHSKDKYSSFTKKIDRVNSIDGVYVYPKNYDAQNAPNSVMVGISGKSLDDSDYKATKIIIKFKKKVNGKTYYSTKTFNKSWVYYKPKNNYRPYYSIVYYKKVKK